MRAAAIGTLIAGLGLIAAAGADENTPDALSPDAFRALVEGRTVHYTVNGTYYGSERFYGKDRATWQSPSGDCEDGVFWNAGEELCFNYGTTSCWRVYQGADDARTAVSRDGFRVDIEFIDDRPLRCEGNPVS